MTNTHHDSDRDHTSPGETSGGMTPQIDDEKLSIAEWSTLAVSAAILVGIVGLITWLAFRGDELPPTIIVEASIQDTRQDESGYYVPITIRNDGDVTVADAIIQGELDTGSGQPQSAEVTVSFLAAHEEVAATLVFRDDPSTGELTTGVTSFREP